MEYPPDHLKLRLVRCILSQAAFCSAGTKFDWCMHELFQNMQSEFFVFAGVKP